MDRYGDVAREIIGLVERRMRRTPSSGSGEGRLPLEKDHQVSEAKVAGMLRELMNLKHSCINCERLRTDDWSCYQGGRQEIADPFEERADCNAWKSAGASPGLGPFPPCTPEYEYFVWNEKEETLLDNFGNVISARREGAPKEKRKSCQVTRKALGRKQSV